MILIYNELKGDKIMYGVNVYQETDDGQIHDTDCYFFNTEAEAKTFEEAMNKKGKELFHPIRKALTALDNGPELKTLLPLIGYEKAFKRLKGTKA